MVDMNDKYEVNLEDLEDLFRDGVAIAKVPEKEMVHHPSHYNQFKRETIEEMRLIFGDEAVIAFCKCSAWKYIRRADFKGKKKQDLEKAEEYMDFIVKIQSESEGK